MTACLLCNATAEDYFDDANDFSFDGKTAEELVTQKLSFIKKTREKYEQFWLKSVKPSVEDDEYGTDVEFVKPLRPLL